jgi:hypothetical protein
MLAFGMTRLTSLSGTDDLKPLHGLPIMNFHDAFEAQSHLLIFILGCNGERTGTKDEEDHRNSEVHHNA